MTRVARLVAVVAGLVLMVNATTSWGQIPNPTASDGHASTAGGSGALGTDEKGYDLSNGGGNTAFGFQALRHPASGIFFNTAVGMWTLGGLAQFSTGAPVSGDNNTAIGASALALNSTGVNNTATGAEALRSNTTGINNTATGFEALFNTTTGRDNTASGTFALFYNTTGSANTASGIDALLNNTTGGNNAATGAFALVLNTTGNQNTASGGSALADNTTGSGNTAVGFKALRKSLGTKNIGIGYQAGVTLQTGNNNIFIGNRGAGDESQTIRVGTAQTQTFIAGINTTNMSGIGELVAIDPATGQLGFAAASSARYKQDIAPMGSRSEGVLQLRPVTFAYKDDAGATMHYGLVAEEVAAVYPQLVTYAPTGEVRTVKYQELIPMLLNELQRQQQAIKRQEQELAEMSVLRKEMADLRALMGQWREAASLSR